MSKKPKTAVRKQKPKKKHAGAGRLPRKDRGKVTRRLNWEGVVLSVSYEPDWSSMSKHSPDAARAHLEVRRISPDWALLPITETGYRSHFLPPGTVEKVGGPIAYVRAWLDQEAKSPEWKRREFQSRQLSLF